MLTNMRSNDAYLGLPHDIFAFTMLQELTARTIGVELGDYKHAVGSLHLYDEQREKAQQLVDEGWQTTKLPMPPMPLRDPWTSIRKVLKAESAIRRHIKLDIHKLHFDEYWGDIVRLLQIYQNYKDRNRSEIVRLKNEMSSSVYNTYIDKKKESKQRLARTKTVQRELF